MSKYRKASPILGPNRFRLPRCKLSYFDTRENATCIVGVARSSMAQRARAVRIGRDLAHQALGRVKAKSDCVWRWCGLRPSDIRKACERECGQRPASMRNLHG